MIEFDIHQLIPEFLMNDRNGYAIAKALEAGIKSMFRIIENGLSVVKDVEAMPEWRLDEVAWEYNIPYDYNADISVKREWIRNASVMSRLYGTPEGIIQYMSGYFNNAILEEAKDYDGDPFHFRMIFPGSWTPENVSWSHKAINTVKNARSILDCCIYKEQWKRTLHAGCALYNFEQTSYPIHATGIDVDCYADEDGKMLLDERGYPLIVED